MRRKIVEVKIEAMEGLLTVVPKVVVINTPGNHDHVFDFLLYKSLGMRFSGSKRVEVSTAVTPRATSSSGRR